MAKKGGKKGKDKKKKASTVSADAAPSARRIIIPEKPPEPPPPPPLRQPLEPCPPTTKTTVIKPEPNHYPSVLTVPATISVVGSEMGCFDSIMKMLRAGFRCAERVFVMTPWGNYVVFRYPVKEDFIYFLYDGCTCNVNRFRYLDLYCGTAGFLHFTQILDVVTYIIHSRKMHLSLETLNKLSVDQIIQEYGEVTYSAKSHCMKYS